MVVDDDDDDDKDPVPPLLLLPSGGWLVLVLSSSDSPHRPGRLLSTEVLGLLELVELHVWFVVLMPSLRSIESVRLATDWSSKTN